MSLKQKINSDHLPIHIAVIMDGNGRWARKQNAERVFGHKNGVNAVRETVEACAELGVKYLTLYAFSSENWQRPKSEVDALMRLLVESLNAERENLNKNNIRLKAIGNLDSLPDDCYQKLMDIIQDTANNTGLNLVLALSYSSRWEITEAVKKIADKVVAGSLKLEDITEDTVSKHLCTNEIPDPELLIRTSGEHRISNYLLWQIVYAELYFTPVLWPDFCKEDLYKAILDFQGRERRFGKTSEQLIKA